MVAFPVIFLYFCIKEGEMKIKLVSFNQSTSDGCVYKKEAFEEYLNTHKNELFNVTINGSKNRIGVLTHITEDDNGIYGEYFPLETDIARLLSQMERKKIIEFEPTVEKNELGNIKINEISIVKKKDKKNGTTSKKNN